LPHSESF